MKNVVIKVGTGVLASEEGEIKEENLNNICQAASDLTLSMRFWPTIVSSGAVACGLGLTREHPLHSPIISPRELPLKQALAAMGQPELYDRYRRRLKVFHSLKAAQLLLTDHNFGEPVEIQNIVSTHNMLTRDFSAIPIINENDPVATDEFRTDNDILAGKLARAVRASHVVIVSSAGGLQDSEGQIVPVVSTYDHDYYRGFIRPETSNDGRGGMASKYDTMCDLAHAGVHGAIIGEGSILDIPDIIQLSAKAGTVFEP